jgi:rhodanese-related sulfurtransferase/predicted double-glycine peptidase
MRTPTLLLWLVFPFAYVPVLQGGGAEIENERASKAKEMLDLPLHKPVVSGPFCGIYSVVATMNTLAIDVPVRGLVAHRYIGSHQGSTAAELIRAIEDYGANAEPFVNLTVSELKRADSAMILHVRSSWSDRRYNHWVTFLGFDGERVILLDFPHAEQSITQAELMAIWNGVGIVVSKEPPDPHALLLPTRLMYVLGTLSAIACFLLIPASLKGFDAASLSLPRWIRLKRVCLQAVVIVGVVFVAAFTFHAVSPTGFLRNPTAVAEVARRYHSVEFPEVSTEQMEQIITEKKTTIIDARFAEDYHFSAMPNAINIPVHSALEHRQKALRGIALRQPIVVYCQSSSCDFSDEIAKFLKFNGFTNVAIYRGGFRDWSRRHPQVQKERDFSY